MFSISVRLHKTEYLDKTILAKMDNSTFWRDFNFRNWAIIGVIRISKPVGFETRAPVRLQRSDQFQVVDTRIP